MDPRHIRFFRLLLLSLPFLLLACHGVGSVQDSSDSTGILYSAPVVGATETYVAYRYGTFLERDLVKTYLQERVTLKVVAVSDQEIRLEETFCNEDEPACQTQDLKVNRKTGKVELLGDPGWSVLMPVNAFPEGIFSEDQNRTISFDGYVPVTQGVTVGVAPQYQLRSGTYHDLTVMADPTDIPVDGGGKCFVLTRKDRLIDIVSYQVFGVDGGWEIQE